MHACMHTCMHTYVHAYMHPCIHASMHARCREFPGTMFRNCAGKFKHMRPKIRESTSVFSRGWPEIEKLRRHVREHLPSSPHSMAMHSRCHLNAYGHLYLSASTPHPGRSQAKPNHAANSPRKVTMHFYAPSKCIWHVVSEKRSSLWLDFAKNVSEKCRWTFLTKRSQFPEHVCPKIPSYVRKC